MSYNILRPLSLLLVFLFSVGVELGVAILRENDNRAWHDGPEQPATDMNCPRFDWILGPRAFAD